MGNSKPALAHSPIFLIYSEAEIAILKNPLDQLIHHEQEGKLIANEFLHLQPKQPEMKHSIYCLLLLKHQYWQPIKVTN